MNPNNQNFTQQTGQHTGIIGQAENLLTHQTGQHTGTLGQTVPLLAGQQTGQHTGIIGQAENLLTHQTGQHTGLIGQTAPLIAGQQMGQHTGVIGQAGNLLTHQTGQHTGVIGQAQNLLTGAHGQPGVIPGQHTGIIGQAENLLTHQTGQHTGLIGQTVPLIAGQQIGQHVGQHAGLTGQAGNLLTGVQGQPGYVAGQPTAYHTGLVGQPAGPASFSPSYNVPAGSDTISGISQGTFVFRPLEGKFMKDKDLIGKMDPFCKIKLGWHKGKTAVAKSQGTNPVWTDVIALPRKQNALFAKLTVKDKDKVLGSRLGEAKIDLAEVLASGRVQKWYPVYKKDQVTGEVLMDVEYTPVLIK